MMSASKIDRRKELRALDNTLQEKKDEFEAIRKDVETVKAFLSEAQQNRLAEIDREWNDFELE